MCETTGVVGIEANQTMFSADPDKTNTILMKGEDIVDSVLFSRTMTGETGIGAADRETDHNFASTSSNCDESFPHCA